MPLIGHKPVLMKTNESVLTIVNSVFFEENNYFKINQLIDSRNFQFPVCLYHPTDDPLCPRFRLDDIIKFTTKAGGSYEQLAMYGAVILITIKWDCWMAGWLSSKEKCSPVYSFERIDDDHFDSSIRKSIQYLYRKSFVRQIPSEDGKKRTTIRSFRMRFLVKVSASLSQYNFYNFVTSLSAYSGIFALMLIPFQMIIVRWLKKFNIEEIINYPNI